MNKCRAVTRQLVSNMKIVENDVEIYSRDRILRIKHKITRNVKLTKNNSHTVDDLFYLGAALSTCCSLSDGSEDSRSGVGVASALAGISTSSFCVYESIETLGLLLIILS